MDDTNFTTELLAAQKNEITEYEIYRRISRRVHDLHNSNTLEAIAEDELSHYNLLKKYSGRECSPDLLRVWLYTLASRFLGIIFVLKLLEGREAGRNQYLTLSGRVAEVAQIIGDETRHEAELIGMIDEDRMKYLGAIVLGLNDALVEMTGTLAGLTFAFQNSRIIALAGLVTGIAASLSMATSEYFSMKAEPGPRTPIRGAFYTGFAYIVTVMFLVFPFLVFVNFYFAFVITLINAVLVILVFTWYSSVTQGLPFVPKFREMLLISFAVAGLSFGMGLVIRLLLNVTI